MTQPSTNVRDLKQRAHLPAKTDGGATVREFLKSKKALISQVLPNHMTPERVMQVATQAIRTPQLMECTVESLVGGVVQSSILGLELGGALGHAYLVPFWNSKKKCKEAQFIPGYRGLIDLARRSGQIVSISARAVREEDDFRYEYGLKEDLHHVPVSGDRGEITYFYAVAHLVGGGHAFEVLSRKDVESIRNGSSGYQTALKFNNKNTPWIQHFEEMGRKTMIRRLFKYLPVSIQISQAVAMDEVHDAGGDQHLDSAIDGEYSIETEDYNRVDSETGEDPRQEQKAPEEPTPERWPQRITDEGTGELRWADSAGHFYNPELHGMSADRKTPSVTKEGVFRARRGAGGRNASAGPEPTARPGSGQQQAQPADDAAAPAVTADELAERVQAAQSTEELDDIEDLMRSLADSAERNAVRAIIEKRRGVLGG